jgi:hypothetical protein
VAESVKVANNDLSALQCNRKTPADLIASFQGFSPPPGWAKLNPELALKLLFIFPQDAPWVNEILGQQ